MAFPGVNLTAILANSTLAAALEAHFIAVFSRAAGVPSSQVAISFNATAPEGMGVDAGDDEIKAAHNVTWYAIALITFDWDDLDKAEAFEELLEGSDEHIDANASTTVNGTNAAAHNLSSMIDISAAPNAPAFSIFADDLFWATLALDPPEPEELRAEAIASALAAQFAEAFGVPLVATDAIDENAYYQSPATPRLDALVELPEDDPAAAVALANDTIQGQAFAAELAAQAGATLYFFDVSLGQLQAPLAPPRPPAAPPSPPAAPLELLRVTALADLDHSVWSTSAPPLPAAPGDPWLVPADLLRAALHRAVTEAASADNPVTVVEWGGAQYWVGAAARLHPVNTWSAAQDAAFAAAVTAVCGDDVGAANVTVTATAPAPATTLAPPAASDDATRRRRRLVGDAGDLAGWVSVEYDVAAEGAEQAARCAEAVRAAETVVVAGLQSETVYTVYVMAVEPSTDALQASGLPPLRSSVAALEFRTADITPPSFASGGYPRLQDVSADAISFVVALTEPGRVYYNVKETPSVQHIMFGVIPVAAVASMANVPVAFEAVAVEVRGLNSESEYTIHLLAEDSAAPPNWQAEPSQLQATTLDITPPSIQLHGAALLQIEQGSVYHDLGASAYDTFDGDISHLPLSPPPSPPAQSQLPSPSPPVQILDSSLHADDGFIPGIGAGGAGGGSDLAVIARRVPQFTDGSPAVGAVGGETVRLSVEADAPALVYYFVEAAGGAASAVVVYGVAAEHLLELPGWADASDGELNNVTALVAAFEESLAVVCGVGPADVTAVLTSDLQSRDTVAAAGSGDTGDEAAAGDASGSARTDEVRLVSRVNVGDGTSAAAERVGVMMEEASTDGTLLREVQARVNRGDEVHNVSLAEWRIAGTAREEVLMAAGSVGASNGAWRGTKNIRPFCILCPRMHNVCPVNVLSFT
eukprot:gene13249-15656_t